ncbi:hypothetical protein MUK42_25249 [Musa troglodytarum]|uniref:Uncharacterized protein n=1 Tax=Musa troglodytarum TaxID=320322 RepID=A0A9E7EA88_9LILI|nr:hypothetical protein MUK42_25249 [Musa troglodytarum]
MNPTIIMKFHLRKEKSMKLCCDASLELLQATGAMNEKPEHVIPQILNKTDNLKCQQANGKGDCSHKSVAKIIKTSDKKWEETIRHAEWEMVKLVYEAYQNCKRLERVVGMTSMIGVQKQSENYLFLVTNSVLVCFPVSMQECELESDERRCSNPPDGSRRELSAGNVTPPLGASACVLEQLPSQQRAGAECENWNPRTPLEEPWKRNNNKVIILATKVD